MKKIWISWVTVGLGLEAYALAKQKAPLTHVIRSIPGDRSRRVIIGAIWLWVFGHLVLEKW